MQHQTWWIKDIDQIRNFVNEMQNKRKQVGMPALSLVVSEAKDNGWAWNLKVSMRMQPPHVALPIYDS